MTEVNFKWLTGENVKFNIGNKRATAEPTGEEATKHRATENLHSEFPWRRFSLSIVGIWMCLTIHIVIVQQNCCDLGGGEQRPATQARAGFFAWIPIRNNGYCECGALNATCGCTTFITTYSDGGYSELTMCGNGCCAYGECTPLFNASKSIQCSRDGVCRERVWYGNKSTYDLSLCAPEDDEQIMLLSSPRAPDCNCCSSHIGLISGISFAIFVVSWLLLLVFDLKNKSNGPGLYWKVRAAALL